MRVSSLVNGQKVTIGPMAYNKAAIDRCAMKCELQFHGAGGIITGVFFTAAYADKLKGKSGGAYITGIVKKNGSSVNMIIQGVR